jgi:CubicO group peptidase (beta-lactamase class C family)
MNRTKTILAVAFNVLIICTLTSQNLYFPPVEGNEWDTVSPASLGWCVDEIPELLDYLEARNTRAFILLQDGKIAIEQYFGTFTADSVWYWASAGKTLAAFMVGIAQQEGYLSVTDTTSDYLGTGWTSCPPSEEEKVTIWNQLTMTSGFDDYVTDPYCTLPSCISCIAEPGTRWAYHNAPYTLLHEVVEQATGHTMNQYLLEKLGEPTGISGAFFPQGYNRLFISKARMMARFGLLTLNNGNWDGNQVMTDTAYFNQMVTTSQGLNLAYGYLWWLNGTNSFMVPGLQFVFPVSMNPHAPDDMIAAMGKNGQLLNVVPDMNLVYVRMGDEPSPGQTGISFNDTIWQKLNDVMCNVMVDEAIPHRNVELKIFPNPARSSTLVQQAGIPFDLFLYDLSGRIVFAQIGINSKTEVPLDNLRSGIYFVQTKDRAGIIRQHKLMVRR